MDELWHKLEEDLNSIKGSFSTEQFGVFLNMYLDEVNDNYLVAFHEDYHYWQSVFTSYGHIKWGINRSFSIEVINSWLNATKGLPNARVIPAASIIPSDDISAVGSVSKIFLQYVARMISNLTDRNSNNPLVRDYIELNDTSISPIININGEPYELNGIDILEGLAKYQEAVLAYISENKPISETINKETLSPNYYSALEYFLEKIGEDRITEFPVVCELALCVSGLCAPGKPGWKKQHPAWRFIEIIEVISKYSASKHLYISRLKDQYCFYITSVLEECGYDSYPECWSEAKKYAQKEKLEISNDMLRAIEFKQKYPWILAFPFIDLDAFHLMTEFGPYYYITMDGSGFVVKSEDQGNEVILEIQFQALANQICGIVSKRCQDTGLIQCGYSYYGIKRCPYWLNGSCDGHIDKDSTLPGIEMNIYGQIINGCAFDAFLSIMGVRVKDLVITDTSKTINPLLLEENIKKFDR